MSEGECCSGFVERVWTDTRYSTWNGSILVSSLRYLFICHGTSTRR